MARLDVKNAPVLDQEPHVEYGRRSFATVVKIGVIAAVLLLGVLFVFDSGREKNRPVARSEAIEGETGGGVAAQSYEADLGIWGAVKSFFSEIVHTTRNLREESDTLTSSYRQPGMAAELRLQRYYDRYRNIYEETGAYNVSVRDVIGARVADAGRQKIGAVYDILVDRKTGDASLLIVDSGGAYYDSQLKALRFADVFEQDARGRALLTLERADMNQLPDFRYDSSLKKNYVSLRSLQEARFLDENANMIGDVESILYENAAAQRLYFSVKPTLTASGQPRYFSLPYEAVEVVESADGYDIVLNSEQVKALNLQDMR